MESIVILGKDFSQDYKMGCSNAETLKQPIDY